MEHFIREQTDKTPYVNFNPENGEFLLSGRSIPENTIKFYQKVLNWLQEYALNPAPETNLTIYLLYFGTSSAKCLLDILKILQKLHFEQKTVATIRWQYIVDDEDMLEAGKNYNEMLQNIQFNFISVTESDDEVE